MMFEISGTIDYPLFTQIFLIYIKVAVVIKSFGCVDCHMTALRMCSLGR